MCNGEKRRTSTRGLVEEEVPFLLEEGLHFGILHARACEYIQLCVTESMCVYIRTQHIYTHRHMHARMFLSYGVAVAGGILECGSLSQKHRSLLEGLFYCKRDLYISMGARRVVAAPNWTLGRAT